MLPVVVVFGRIDVDRFAWSAMNGEIGLAVAIEVERSEQTRPGTGSLKCQSILACRC